MVEQLRHSFALIVSLWAGGIRDLAHAQKLGPAVEDGLFAELTSSEEIALRRFTHVVTKPSSLTQSDIDKLKSLALIEARVDGFVRTTLGERRVAQRASSSGRMTTLFVRGLGYGWLTVAFIVMLWSLGMAWWRDGLSIALEMLAVNGALNYVVVAVAITPAVVLILLAMWLQRRDDRE